MRRQKQQQQKVQEGLTYQYAVNLLQDGKSQKQSLLAESAELERNNRNETRNTKDATKSIWQQYSFFED